MQFHRWRKDFIKSSKGQFDLGVTKHTERVILG